MLTRFVSSPEGKAGAEKKNALRRFKRADLEVSDKIGKGAYGGVWQATVLDTKQEVVVKVMWPDADLDPEDAKNESPGQHRKDAFKREIEMMRRVGSHPNIIAVLGATADSTVIVFEEALTDLHVIIKKQKRSLSLPIIRRCTRDILKGVEYLHEIKVAHRDLKPANILVFKDMTCKLGDFGLAREFGDNQEMTVKNEVSTLWYRAPELLMGFATYLPIIDEWSTGCILLEMLTGRCSLMGRVEDVCDCPQPTHFNYNSDQLLKIFHLVGSAAEEDLLSKSNCLKHFQSWPKHRPTLENVVRSMCTEGRFKSTDKLAERELEERIQRWLKVANALLTLNPRKRLAAKEVLELALFQDDKDKQAPVAASKSPSFSRVQSLPTGATSSATATKENSNSSTGKYHLQTSSPSRELTASLKPSKKLVLHPFNRTGASQDQHPPSAAGGSQAPALAGGVASPSRMASAGAHTELSTKDHIAEGRKINVSIHANIPRRNSSANNDFANGFAVGFAAKSTNAGIARVTSAHSQATPTSLAAYNPIPPTGSLTRVHSAGSQGAKGLYRSSVDKGASIGALYRSPVETSMAAKEASLRSHSHTPPAHKVFGGGDDACYDLIG